MTSAPERAVRQSNRDPLLCPIAAFLPPLVALAIQLLLGSTTDPYAWFLFYPAVFVSSWIGGLRAGMGASAISVVMVLWFFVPPTHDFDKPLRVFASAGTFLATGIVLGLFHERLRNANRWIVEHLAESERANQRLKEVVQERRVFAALIEASSDFIGIADADGRPFYLNPAGRRLVGLAPDFPIETTNMVDYYPPEYRTFATEVIVESTLERGQWHGETFFRNWRTGESIPVSDVHFMIRDPDTGDTLGIGTVTRDICDAKRSERDQKLLAEVGAAVGATLDYEETLRAIADLAVRDLADIAIIDLVEEREVRRLKVASRDPANGWICDFLSHYPLDPSRVKLLRAVFDRHQPVLIEHVSEDIVRQIARDEEHLRVIHTLDPKSVMSVPLLVHGKLVGALTLVSTRASCIYGPADLRLAEELALRAALAIENARLYRVATRAIEARDDVLTVVAHDLRSPLGNILMQAKLLRPPESPCEPGSKEPADVIERAARRMSRLIQDLMDVTRLETGHMPLDRCRVPTAQVICDCADSHKAFAASAAVELKLEVSSTLPDVWADRHRLLQALENLLGNALKFTSRGGCVTVGAKAQGSEIVFRVVDNGAGIAAQDLTHVFDRFWQARRVKRSGAGLGLAIVKGIVEAHGGRVWVDSSPGRGSTFFFTIPAAPRVDRREHAQIHRGA